MQQTHATVLIRYIPLGVFSFKTSIQTKVVVVSWNLLVSVQKTCAWCCHGHNAQCKSSLSIQYLCNKVLRRDQISGLSLCYVTKGSGTAVLNTWFCHHLVVSVVVLFFAQPMTGIYLIWNVEDWCRDAKYGSGSISYLSITISPP